MGGYISLASLTFFYCDAHLENRTMSKLTEEEGRNLGDLLRKMGLQPKGKTPDELQAWMEQSMGTATVEQDVEKLLTTETQTGVGRTSQQVRLSVTFSGDEDAKGECRYDLWKYEVECLVKDGVHTEETIRHVIRRSLKGEAAHVLKRLGPNATVQQILQKFDGVYGIVEAGEETLAEFYSARQKETEDVSTWGCRLEELLDRAVHAGVLGDKDTDEMLRKRFWTGLCPKLKEASRHKFDSIMDFDRLRVVVRTIAHEFKAEGARDKEVMKESKRTAKMATVKHEQETGDNHSISELKGIVCKLFNKVDAMQEQLTGLKRGSGAKGEIKQQGRQETRDQEGRRKPEKPDQDSASISGCWNCQDPNHRKFECPLLPECFKCHKRGHVQKYCRLNRN